MLVTGYEGCPGYEDGQQVIVPGHKDISAEVRGY